MIYGPPGVGKFTVARELQKITGYPLLHNHVLADALGPIFGFGTKSGKEVNARLRAYVYEQAAKRRIPGLISTFSYYGGIEDDGYVRLWIKSVKKHGGRIHFVRLCCKRAVLEKRITHPSRKIFKKITTKTKLREVLQKHNLLSVIPSRITRSLTVDNTNVPAITAARRIKSFYRL